MIRAVTNLKERPSERPAMPALRFDPLREPMRRQRAEALLARHSPEDVIAADAAERRRWVIDAMLAFADEEKRNV